SVSGEIRGNYYVGGLTGTNKNSGLLSNSYSLAKVSGKSQVGGLAASNYGNVEYSYATGQVVDLSGASAAAGGLIGKNDGEKVKHSYWDKETTKQAASSGSDKAFGLITADFAKKASFEGWNFEKIWKISKEGPTANRPCLQYELYDYYIEISDAQKTALKSSSGDRGYKLGDQVTLSVEALPGWRFEKWTARGKDIADAGNPYTFTVAAGNPTVYTAVFAEDYEFAGGEGTKENPYQIAALKQLSYLSYVPSLRSKHFILNNNIDAAETAQWHGGKGFLPIGQTWNYAFRGTFNGNGKTIKNLTINRPGEDHAALFGYTGWNPAKIEKLQLINVRITGKNTVGGLASHNCGNVSQCSVSGEIRGNYYVGGLTGYNNKGLLSNSYSLAKVSGNRGVGGLAGSNFYGNVEYSYAAGQVIDLNEASATVGGLIGDNYSDGKVQHSYWNKETTKQAVSSGSDKAFGLTTAAFAKKASFNEWNF
ncbi:MAG: hypothetical protein MI739_03480, partial [Bacteroidales bacterium]|nr:hypothetical protein [Bacteroidales bacterium]